METAVHTTRLEATYDSGVAAQPRVAPRLRPATAWALSCLAVDCALRGEPGVIGHDEERGDELRAIEFDRIKGGKAFDIATPWFGQLLEGIGQPPAQPAPSVEH